ncbi:Tubby-like F-box protein 7 [Senna tora]|uniref:Tubby-like F-box protein 7 n=1 Tax=Senna tora TaxID=362788 RepID=A0A834TI44_9FABA|nr:Tubby-like F-box protein 7 [Senna tora]
MIYNLHTNIKAKSNSGKPNPKQRKNLNQYLFKARRESNFAALRRGLHDLPGNIPPPLAHTRGSDDVLPARPLLLAGLHSPYDLPEQLRKHGGPRIAIARILTGLRRVAAAEPITTLIFVKRCSFLEGSGEFTRAENFNQRHSLGLCSMVGEKMMG